MFNAHMGRVGLGVVVLALEGELDYHSVVQVDEALAAVQEDGPVNVLIADCAALDYCDSTGVSALIRCYTAVQGAGGSFRIAEIPANLGRMFEITGLSSLFTCHDTVAAALKDVAAQAGDGSDEAGAAVPSELTEEGQWR